MEPSDLDNQAKILTNSIRENEGGDDYNASGDDGQSWGAYQMKQGAWDNASKIAGVNAQWGKATPAEQNQVADSQVKTWLSQGKNPAQVASMWNAGAGEPDAYTGKFSNGHPSVVPGKFDVPSYAKRVLSNASELWQNQQNSGTVSSLSAPEKVAGGAGLAGLGLIGGAIAPEAEAVLEGGSSIVGGIGNAIKGGLADIGLGGLFGGSGNSQEQAPTVPAPSPESGMLASALTAPPPSATPTSAPAAQQAPQIPAQPTPVPPIANIPTSPQIPQQDVTKTSAYGTLNSLLGSMIGGQQVMEEAKNRGVDPVAEMVKTGHVPQPDEAGNFDKITPYIGLQKLVKQDKDEQRTFSEKMHSPTDLGDMERATIHEVESKMKDSPHLSDTKRRVHKLFADYRAEQPEKVDKNGKKYNRKFIDPKTLQHMKDRVSEGDNWMLPAHERAASQHAYTAMKKRLSDIAKQEGVKGWDETNKRMEARLLAMKAIKKLPKKAQRDFKKEMLKDIAAGLGGALIGKTLGNGIIGGTAGYLLHKRLGEKKYQSIGSKKELQEIEKNRSLPQKGLLAKGPNQ